MPGPATVRGRRSLGEAVARRYARGGYAVTLVARRPEPLDHLAKDLTRAGATAHVITADLSDTGAAPRLTEQIRAQAVDPGHLADPLWTMHGTKGQPEAIYP
jgi:NADP-dependent 3-hydroxy acid dehydrogenase YdfG